MPEPTVRLTRTQIERWHGARRQPLADQISPVYLVPTPVDPDLLAHALADVARRHTPLRTRIVAGPDGRPRATRRDVPTRYPLTVHDLRALPADEREAVCRRTAGDEAADPLDLGTGRPLRATLLTLAEDRHLLLLSLSHVTADGWSCGVLVREVQARYRALRDDPTAPEGPAATDWERYVAQCAEDETAGRPARDLPWWRTHLAGAVPPLPLAPPAAGTEDLTAGTVGFELPAATGEKLRRCAAARHTTVYAVTLAAFAAALAQPTGAEEAVTTVPYAGRDELEHESLVGLFTTRLALRLPLAHDAPFTAAVDAVNEALLDALDHSPTPFPLIEQSLAADGVPPLGQVTVQVYPRSLCDAPATATDDLACHLLGFRTLALHRSLGLFLTEPDSGPVIGALCHRLATVPAETATDLVLRFTALLDAALSSPDRPLRSLLPRTTPTDRSVLRTDTPWETAVRHRAPS
ncbi:condensation domain-containing protein [Kitasatospora sp. NPDC093806]|uniref:condensation domain-containing protein n=1 Tax=Kitasatospora sp. NPDC093806 TaxID=3155075 RepID=UPI0034191762